MPLKTSQLLFPALYVLLAFALSAWLLQFNHFINPDGVYYARVGLNLISGKGLVFNPGEPYLDHPPFYAFLIGLVSLFLKNPELSGHLISILAFSLNLVPLFLLTRKIYPGPTAHWFSLLYVTHGFLLIYSNLMIAEPLFTFLVSTELYLLYKIVHEKNTRIVSGLPMGILGGLLYLTRPEGQFFYLAGLLSILLLSSRPLSVRSRIVGLSLAGAAVFFLPYLHFIHQSTHQWRLSGVAGRAVIRQQFDVSQPVPYLELKKIYQGLSTDKRRLKMDELAEKFNLTDYLVKDDFALLRAAAPSAVSRLLGVSPYFFSGLGFLLIGASCFSSRWSQNRWKSELLLIFFLLPFLCYSFTVFEQRYYFTYLPLLLIWAGNGIEVLRVRSKANFRFTERTSRAFALSLCFFLALGSAWYLYRNFRTTSYPLEQKELGLWMRKNIPDVENEYVAAQDPIVNFYSGSKILKLPYVDRLDDFRIYMKHKKAKYFVVNEDLDTPTLYSYAFLLEDKNPLPSGIFLKHSITRRHKASLYEIP